MEKQKRYYTLDLIIFICSILILLHHFEQVFDIRFRYLDLNHSSFYFGYLVELFFIISSFLSSEKRKISTDQSFRSYFRHKIIRLYPMCFLSITMILVINFLSIFINGYSLITDGLGIWKLFNNYLLIFSGWIYESDSLGLNNPLWYICVLLLCYILFYFFTYISRKKNWPLTYIVIFFLFLSSWSYRHNIDLPFFNSSSLRGYQAFFTGVLLYMVYEKIQLKNRCFFSCVSFWHHTSSSTSLPLISLLMISIRS